MPKVAFHIAGYDDLSHLMLEMKIKRIPLFALFALFFQLVNLLNENFFKTKLVSMGLIAVSCVAGSYFILIMVFKNKILRSARWMQIIALSFWILLILSITPFVLNDIIYWKIPINATVACLGLSIAPLYGKKEAIGVLLLFLGLNFIICWFASATTAYVLMIISVVFLAYIVPTFMQEQYIRIIRTLNTETLCDPLTGLLNRRGGYEKINTVFELCKRHKKYFSVYMIDIDFFKKYNDTYGHMAGDEALQSVAACMREVFSRASDIVCRCGGEEFLIASSLDDPETAFTMAENLRKTIESSHKHQKAFTKQNPLTVSIGYTLYCPSEEFLDVDEIHLISEADQALYLAKNSGRNKVCMFKK